MRHIPALDALRGIAILLVLAGHALRLEGGTLGVDLFFVLSGFLITSLLLSEWSRDERISFGDFYRRRALRLLPALFVMLAVVATAAAFTVDFSTELAWVVYCLFYVSNLVAIHEGGIAAENLQHMWTLAQEEQFYFVWPLVLVLLLRAGAGPRVLAGLLAGLVISYRFALGLGDASRHYLFYAPDTRSDGLALGCLAGVLFSYGMVRRIPLTMPTLLLVPAGVAVAVLDLQSRSHAAVLLPLFTISACVILLACALHAEWWFTRAINRAWLRGLGKISYGLYLWHWPLFVWFGWQLGLPAAIAVAVVSYRYVERPFLRRKSRRATHEHRMPAAADCGA